MPTVYLTIMVLNESTNTREANSAVLVPDVDFIENTPPAQRPPATRPRILRTHNQAVQNFRRMIDGATIRVMENPPPLLVGEDSDTESLPDLHTDALDEELARQEMESPIPSSGHVQHICRGPRAASTSGSVTGVRNQQVDGIISNMEYKLLPADVEYGYIRLDSIARHFECPVCNVTATSPVELACGHIYCAECLLILQKGVRHNGFPNPDHQCTMCTVPYEESKPLGRVLQQIWQQMPRKCAFMGCDMIMRMHEYETHFRQCPRKLQLCYVCKKVFANSQEKAHHRCGPAGILRRNTVIQELIRLQSELASLSNNNTA